MDTIDQTTSLLLSKAKERAFHELRTHKGNRATNELIETCSQWPEENKTR
jgi:hypothetical protein